MSRRDRPMLLPTGTARQSVTAKGALPGELVELFRAGEADESIVFLAWQLTQMTTGLTAVERERFMLVLGRLLVAQATGSTCLLTSDSERALLGRVTDLVGQDRSSPPAPRTPLVLDGTYLYSARAHGWNGATFAASASGARCRTAASATSCITSSTAPA